MLEKPQSDVIQLASSVYSRVKFHSGHKTVPEILHVNNLPKAMNFKDYTFFKTTIKVTQDSLPISCLFTHLAPYGDTGV